MSVQILARPLTMDAFAAYGDVLQVGNIAPADADNGEAAPLAVFESGSAGEPLAIRMVRADAVSPPFQLRALERHVATRMTVLPLSTRLHCLVVAEDQNGFPGAPVAFYTTGRQGVQYRRGVWYRSPAPIGQPQQFCLIESVARRVERCTLDQPQLIGLGIGLERQYAPDAID